MNSKAKGSRRERQVRDIFIKKGYMVIKAGASLGAFDLICVWVDFSKKSIGIQVKSTRIGKQEREELQVFKVGLIKELWIKKDYKPWIRKIWDEKKSEWIIKEVDSA